MKGTVKWFNIKKGFGFVSGEDGKDYFAHFTSVPKGVDLRDNDAVTFDAVETDKGLQAQNIKLGSAESSAPAEAPAQGEVNAEQAPVEEDAEEAPAEQDTEDF